MKKSFICCVTMFIAAVAVSQSGKQLIDKRATAETKALFYNLGKLSETSILFGHQHATEYGHGWSGDEDRSDVKSVTGSHPAVIGVDFSGISGRPNSEIEKTKAALRKNIADTYNRGDRCTTIFKKNHLNKNCFCWLTYQRKINLTLILL